MRIKQRMLAAAVVGAGMAAITALSGCQTYYGGMTLPSPHYLKHPPQYFPPDPSFPLQREVDSMQDPDGALRRGGVAGPALPAIQAPLNAPQQKADPNMAAPAGGK